MLTCPPRNFSTRSAWLEDRAQCPEFARRLNPRRNTSVTYRTPTSTVVGFRPTSLEVPKCGYPGHLNDTTCGTMNEWQILVETQGKHSSSYAHWQYYALRCLGSTFICVTSFFPPSPHILLLSFPASTFERNPPRALTKPRLSVFHI